MNIGKTTHGRLPAIRPRVEVVEPEGESTSTEGAHAGGREKTSQAFQRRTKGHQQSITMRKVA
ncbi:hypothetical protein CKG00_03395 [Morganella morganii]|uniref:Uncharacterized protein n=1 Tax=Morganella morganii TaxID=582 RepID=A0A433ZTU6_MORMO|nr:hypothetical protein CKG00_03395 [Morganella morganii]